MGLLGSWKKEEIKENSRDEETVFMTNALGTLDLNFCFFLKFRILSPLQGL